MIISSIRSFKNFRTFKQHPLSFAAAGDRLAGADVGGGPPAQLFLAAHRVARVGSFLQEHVHERVVADLLADFLVDRSHLVLEGLPLLGGEFDYFD